MGKLTARACARHGVRVAHPWRTQHRPNGTGFSVGTSFLETMMEAIAILVAIVLAFHFGKLYGREREKQDARRRHLEWKKAGQSSLSSDEEMELTDLNRKA